MESWGLFRNKTRYGRGGDHKPNSPRR